MGNYNSRGNSNANNSRGMTMSTMSASSASHAAQLPPVNVGVQQAQRVQQFLSKDQLDRIGVKIPQSRNAFKWENQAAVNQVYLISAQLGNPDMFSTVSGGVAVWKSNMAGRQFLGSRLCFERVLVMDEAIAHNCPSGHSDCVYTAINVDLDSHQVADVISVSGTAWYDALKKLLWVRCGSLAMNIATLKLVSDVLVGSASLADIRVSKSYASTLASVQSNDASMGNVNVANLAALYTTLCANLDKHAQTSNLSPTGYWRSAFNQDCSPAGGPLQESVNASQAVAAPPTTASALGMLTYDIPTSNSNSASSSSANASQAVANAESMTIGRFHDDELPYLDFGNEYSDSVDRFQLDSIDSVSKLANTDTYSERAKLVTSYNFGDPGVGRSIGRNPGQYNPRNSVRNIQPKSQKVSQRSNSNRWIGAHDSAGQERYLNTRTLEGLTVEPTNYKLAPPPMSIDRFSTQLNSQTSVGELADIDNMDERHGICKPTGYGPCEPAFYDNVRNIAMRTRPSGNSEGFYGGHMTGDGKDTGQNLYLRNTQPAFPQRDQSASARCEPNVYAGQSSLGYGYMPSGYVLRPDAAGCAPGGHGAVRNNLSNAFNDNRRSTMLFYRGDGGNNSLSPEDQLMQNVGSGLPDNSYDGAEDVDSEVIDAEENNSEDEDELEGYSEHLPGSSHDSRRSHLRGLPNPNYRPGNKNMNRIGRNVFPGSQNPSRQVKTTPNKIGKSRRGTALGIPRGV